MATDSCFQIPILSAIAILCSCLFVSVNGGESFVLNSSDFSFVGHAAQSLAMMTKSCNPEAIEGCVDEIETELTSAWARRRLLQQTGPYYISYGSLTADRTPCPPMSGRSYYTPDCNGASGPVDPYHRGCSVISRCARDSG